MIKQKKIISLTIIGLLLGGVVGFVVNAEQANVAALAVVGGVTGFLQVGFGIQAQADLKIQAQVDPKDSLHYRRQQILSNRHWSRQE